jgi:hypothetical protein
MRKLLVVLFIVASLAAASSSTAQTLDWETIQQIHPTTPITVVAQKQFHCNFEAANTDKLFCLVVPTNLLPFVNIKPSELVFDRADVREVRLAPDDWSKGYLDLILGAGGGGGWDANHQPAGFGGVKLGGALALDLQYDRIQGHNGFSTAGSAVIPMFRIPSPKLNQDKMFLRTYAEPGIGYRAGGGTFGFYSSAKVLFVLFSVPKWAESSPYVEFERRFPFNSPLQGDNRLTIGVMLAVCQHCGVE